MRKYVKTYELYQFNELGESAKEKVRQWYLDDDMRPYEFKNDTIEDLRNVFGVDSSPEVSFDLSYGQSDYLELSLTVTVDSIRNLTNNWPNIYDDIGYTSPDFTEKEWKRLKHYEMAAISDFEVTMNNWGKYEGCFEWTDDLEYLEYRDIDYDLIEKYYTFVKSLLWHIAKYYKKFGYDFFYTVDDEEVQDACEANEWEFLEDGTFFHNY